MVKEIHILRIFYLRLHIGRSILLKEWKGLVVIYPLWAEAKAHLAALVVNFQVILLVVIIPNLNVGQHNVAYRL